MRSLTIILILAVLLCGFSVFFDLYISREADRLSELALACTTRADTVALREAFEKSSGITELVVDHSEIDALDRYLWAMEEQVGKDDTEFEVSRREVAELFLHIARRNTFSLDCIL